MSSVPKSEKHGQGDCETPNNQLPLEGTPGSSGHKASFRSTKLARRARSFKEDIIEKFSQMRSPSGAVGFRSHSPKARQSNSPSTKFDTVAPNADKCVRKELDIQARQVQVALKHFRDVVSKNKLEMLSGNATIVLEHVSVIHSALKQYLLENEDEKNSSTLESAKHRVYQSLSQLIKLCDDVLIFGDKVLEEKNVEQVVSLLEEAVQNLVTLAQDKISNREAQHKTISLTQKKYGTSPNPLEVPGQRNSLPDIPLTPRERQILEETRGSVNLVRNSHSTESILRDSNPPPKPPLPKDVCFSGQDYICATPPPIPPKKRTTRLQHVIDGNGSSENSLLGFNADRISVRSRSPEDSSSLLSASAGSLDSVLNQSRDEEEIRALMDPSLDECMISNNEFMRQNRNYSWNESTFNSSVNHSSSNPLLDFGGDSFSNNDSDFGSVRSSIQSVSITPTSKRSSQQSSCSSQWNTCQKQSSISSAISQQNTIVKSESIIESMSKVQKSESIIQQISASMETTRVFDSSAFKKVISSQISNHNSLDQVDFVDHSDENGIPPILPEKTKKLRERRPSQYDNVPNDHNFGEHSPTCAINQSYSSNENTSNTEIAETEPPPLPLKKKHIMAYMEMFGNCSQSAANADFTRHSVHTCNLTKNSWQCESSDSISGVNKMVVSLSTTQSSFRVSCDSHSGNLTLPNSSGRSSISPQLSVKSLDYTATTPPALPPKKSRAHLKSASPSNLSSAHFPTFNISSNDNNNKTSSSSIDTLQTPKKTVSNDNEKQLELNEPKNIIEETDISEFLLFKKPEEEGPDIRGGHPDALLIYAAKDNRHAFQDAFLTTYRTFLQPLEVIQKLQYRYQIFSYSESHKLHIARETFYLLISVVSGLTAMDLTNELLQTLMDIVHQLVSNGDLNMSKALRVKILEKNHLKQLRDKQNSQKPSLQSFNICSRNFTLLEFKSEQIAEQMTLLDADLFMKIEIPEVLIWAQEQNEERSPNLTCFTEHFNKMSYWARSRILEQPEAKDRERYVVKFIKIMKHLRKINNFNSYLALLSALDSAPIRRLEWQKNIIEGLKEYCALIDSSSSFRAYRQALSETQPPCIPYIGLILQDLTFVHIGNSDLLPDGSINFSKRWQQFNIVDNMKRFKKETYQFKKLDRIISFFNGFENFISEEAMWQISEKIKPRGSKKTT